MKPVLPLLPVRLRNCSGVLVDSNVLLDLATKDANWGDWSRRALAECADLTQLVINPIVYAEVSVGFTKIEELNLALATTIYTRAALPWEAGFLAGKCFVAYRRRGGSRTTPLPDFYIGAHAAVEQLALLTRDPARYRTYFPKLEILTPAS